MTESETITVGLDVDGYDVEVEIGVGVIKREIEKMEVNNVERINKNGTAFMERNLNYFTPVKVEPTDEKWEELADRQFGEVE